MKIFFRFSPFSDKGFRYNGNLSARFKKEFGDMTSCQSCIHIYMIEELTYSYLGHKSNTNYISRCSKQHKCDIKRIYYDKHECTDFFSKYELKQI